MKGDTMNNQYEPPQSHVADVIHTNDEGITTLMIEAMRRTKPWVLLIGIVLIITAAFMILGTLGVFAASTISLGAEGPEAGAMLGVGVMYAIMSAIYLMLGIYLLKFSSAIGRLVESASVIDMEETLDSQRKFWKLAGILTAVMLVVMIIGFVAAIAIPMLDMGM
jgi:hypothetical protein